MNPVTELLKAMVKPDYTACSYAFMQNGKIVCSDAIGVIDKINNQPISTDCTFNVCSISKIYCTIAIMQLVDEGLIQLEDKVIQYVPEFKMKDKRYKDITIRMCLDHSSGLPGTQWKHFSVHTKEKFDYYQEVLNYLSTSTLKADPGTYSTYCNDGFTLAEIVVAHVRNMPYEDVIKKHITSKIHAESTNPTYSINEKYPLVSEGKKPKEYFPIQGAGGITTSMEDLCKFGQLFLEPNDVISEASKELMAKSWGSTFLDTDLGAIDFGLGWDLVKHHDPDYDFGNGVLAKGGNSMFFSSRLIIVPKYNAVLALSETHDCGLDVPTTLMRLFATYLETQNIHVTPFESSPKNYSGLYAHAFGLEKITTIGFSMVVQEKTEKGFTPTDLFNYKNGKWTNEKGNQIFFEEKNNEIYLLKTTRHRTVPFAQKAHDATLSPAWKARLNKKYIVCDTSYYDIVVNQMLCSVEFNTTQNTLALRVHDNKTNPVISEFPIEIVDDMHAQGYLTTPCNGSRDRIEPYFEKNKLHVASYTYICEDDLQEYEHQSFKQQNQIFKISTKLNDLPNIQEKHRILVLDSNGDLYYDSIDVEEYKPLEKGFIILI